MLRVLKKAVLLHPLSEGTRGRREGNRERKFFESLRPAQDTCAAGAARGKEPFKRNTKRTSRRNPRFRRKI